MRTKMLTAVSAFALLASMPALADTKTGLSVSADTKTTIEAQKENNPAKPDMPTVTEKDIERGWDKTKNAVSDAAEATGDAIEDTYYNITGAFSEDGKVSMDETVTIKTRTTAKGMLGEDAFNAKGESVAKVEDIILDQDGDAQLIVLRDGGFFGLGGKLVALDYDHMTRRNASGDILLPVSEEMIEKVAEFSYDRDNSQKNVRMIPADGISVSNAMKGHLQNNRGENVADVDNVTFVNGEAQYLVISFNEILEMGGDTAVLEFDDLQAMSAGGEVNFKLTAKQSADFETFKKNMESKG